MRFSLKKLGDNIRDIFDANTQDDQKRRMAAGQQRYYSQQQAAIPASQQRPINIIRREFTPALGDTFTKPQTWRQGPRANVGSFTGSGILADFINSPFTVGEG